MHNTDAVIYFGFAFFAFIGWFYAFITYRRKLVKMSAEYARKDYETFKDGFDKGVAYADSEAGKFYRKSRLAERQANFPNNR